jgi:hypothetical protein
MMKPLSAVLICVASIAHAQPEASPEEQPAQPVTATATPATTTSATPATTATATATTATEPPAHAMHHALGMPRNAFVFESRLTGAFNLASGPAGTATVIPGFMLGARLVDRLHLGLEFFLTNFTSASVGNGSGSASTAFTLGPTIAIDILKAAANRVAFYGKIGFGFGAAVVTSQFSPNTFILRFDIGLGVRYAPVPYFAIGMESGFLNVFFSPDKPGTFSISSLYGGIVGTFLYGH